MGYNLERLKRQYGLGSASKLGYIGTTDADRAAYDKYSDEFLLRLQNTPMYANQQFAGSDLTGNYYDNILGAPVYGEGEPVTGPVDPDPDPIVNPVVTPGSGINGGGDGEGQRQRDAAAELEKLLNPNKVSTSNTSALSDLFNNSMYGKIFEGVSDVFGNEGQSYWETKLPPKSMRGGAERAEYIANNPKPWWDQFTYARTPEERAYNSNNSSFLRTGDGALVRSSNGNAVGTGSFGTRPLSYRAPGFGALKSATASIPDFYNDAVSLDNITTTGLALPTITGTGQQLDNNIVANAANAPYKPSVDEMYALETALRDQELFDLANLSAAEEADELELQATMNQLQFGRDQAAKTEPVRTGSRNNNNYEYSAPSAPARGSTARSDRGPGRKGRQAAASNKSATTGGNPFGYNRGGHIKGYAMGGPENRYEIDDATDLEVLAAEATDLEMLATQAQQMSQPSDRANELMTMLQNNTANPNSYSAQLATEQGSYNEAAVAFQDMITKMADNQSRGPDESEKWFRLAAAFGAPTKSGHFTENLGLASSELADISAERRTAGAAGDALKMQGAQFGLELLKDQMENTRGLSAIERQENKDTQKMLLEWQRDNDKLAQERLYDLAVIAGEREYNANKPKSEAAKIATDMGLEGEAYSTYIKKYYNDKQTLAQLELEVLTNSANQLNSGEMKAIDEVDKKLLAADAAVDLLVEALSLNDKAYANNFGDWASSSWDLITLDTENPKYVATQKLELILKKVAAAQLKATFGGAGITDGERTALEKVQGLGVRDSGTRGDVIRLGLEAMRAVQRKNMEKRKSILDRTAYKVTKPGAEE